MKKTINKFQMPVNITECIRYEIYRDIKVYFNLLLEQEELLYDNAGSEITITPLMGISQILKLFMKPSYRCIEDELFNWLFDNAYEIERTLKNQYREIKYEDIDSIFDFIFSSEKILFHFLGLEQFPSIQELNDVIQ